MKKYITFIVRFYKKNIAALKYLFAKKRRRYTIGGISVFLFIWYWFALPSEMFNKPHSLVLESNDGGLLGAKISTDGQWRFPYNEDVPQKFEKCITTFEDKRFYHHIGVDPEALCRAIKQNVSSHRVVSGASTISMQVIRLSRENSARSFSEKFIEMILATRLELKYSKKKILAMYASNAPFGGNVVGLEAASWRYYGKSAKELSWGEMATLAVLPNSPSLVHPGKNRSILLEKRNFLLQKLIENGDVDKTTGTLAMQEPLPDKPFPLPSYAPHLMERIYTSLGKKKHEDMIIKTSIDLQMQQTTNSIIQKHFQQLDANGVHNAAAIILDVETGNVLAYTGNTNSDKPEYTTDVDNICAPRSTGSILKPFLYSSMLNDGDLLPDMLIPDIPTYINSYTPKNFNSEYDGAVPASRALARSLNIPPVYMLQSYSTNAFTYRLRKLGLTTVNKPGSYYGLSLILGGAEANLWDLSGVYASMARTLNHYNENNGKYSPDDFHAPEYLLTDDSKQENKNIRKKGTRTAPILNASPIWLTFKAMVEVSRPDEEKYWANFSNKQKIAWKTGTSFGNRDAWAIGCTKKYVVAIWVGNSSGEGRDGLTGISSAAPILFDIFNTLPHDNDWFKQPVDDMEEIKICKQSGYRASDICTDVVNQWVPRSGINTALCPYHKLINLDVTKKFRVHSDCEMVRNMTQKAWFVLPPSEEAYYKLKHPDYIILPAYRPDCFLTADNTASKAMRLVYPQNPTKIYLPVNLDGTTDKTVFDVTHRRGNAVIYWHLDENFIGTTKNGMHQMALSPEEGEHTLTLIDDQGERLQQHFEIETKKKNVSLALYVNKK